MILEADTGPVSSSPASSWGSGGGSTRTPPHGSIEADLDVTTFDMDGARVFGAAPTSWTTADLVGSSDLDLLMEFDNPNFAVHAGTVEYLWFEVPGPDHTEYFGTIPLAYRACTPPPPDPNSCTDSDSDGVPDVCDDCPSSDDGGLTLDGCP